MTTTTKKASKAEAVKQLLAVVKKLGVEITVITGGSWDEIDECWAFESKRGGFSYSAGELRYTRGPTKKVGAELSAEQLATRAIALRKAVFPTIEFKKFSEEVQVLGDRSRLYVWNTSAKSFRAEHGWSTIDLALGIDGAIHTFGYYDNYRSL